MDRRTFLTGAAAATAVACARPLIRLPRARELTSILPGLGTVDGAGVRLTRFIAQPALQQLDPFVLLDRMASDNPRDYLAGFPDHPHRGFETITLMLAGEVRHRDSKGHGGLVGPGDVQWMTAGRGIVHSEMPGPVDGHLAGFQLWLNLPAREKMRPQEYHPFGAAQLGTGRLGAGGSLHVIAGDVLGARGPMDARPTEPLLLTASLEDDQPLQLDLPAAHAGFVVVHAGEVLVGDRQRLSAGAIGILGPGDQLRLRADTQRSQVLVAAARPLGEPIARRGPFVMNSDAELDQAFADYRNGTLTL